MKLVLLNVHHYFRVESSPLEVRLAMTDGDFESSMKGTITVTIESPDLKALTLAEPESLAITKALAAIQSPAGA